MEESPHAHKNAQGSWLADCPHCKEVHIVTPDPQKVYTCPKTGKQFTIRGE